jgi:hypothetical protein
MTKMLLITSDRAVVDAVRATGADPQTFERIGQAAASGQLAGADVVLYGHDVLATLAAVGVPTVRAEIAAVFTVKVTTTQATYADLAGATTLLVLPEGGQWLHDHTFVGA